VSSFAIHTADNHPEHAEEIIGMIKTKYGFVPGLLGALAESPSAAGAYLALGDALRKSSFTPTERHVVWFTINTIHDCHYCMAAHTGIAKGENIPDDVIETARAGGDYDDPKLQALKVFTTKMAIERGWVRAADIEALFAAGYTHQTVLDVILAVSHKVLSNYTNHVVQTPVDARFAQYQWTPSAAAAE
jgi:alkylhydroperoxidase family enzyme